MTPAGGQEGNHEARECCEPFMNPTALGNSRCSELQTTSVLSLTARTSCSHQPAFPSKEHSWRRPRPYLRRACAAAGHQEATGVSEQPASRAGAEARAHRKPAPLPSAFPLAASAAASGVSKTLGLRCAGLPPLLPPLCFFPALCFCPALCFFPPLCRRLRCVAAGAAPAPAASGEAAGATSAAGAEAPAWRAPSPPAPASE